MSLVNCSANAATACASAIVARLDAAVSQRGRATLAISGGSSPRPMFEFFARSGRDWSLIDVYWVDERCVPPEDPRSNYKLASDVWQAPNFHRVLTELGADEAAGRYDADLRAAGPFDVIHRGMGADGHTASLFPGNPLIADRKHFAAAVPGTPPRITMLPAVLEAARWTAVLATGADKAAMLNQVLHSPYDPVKYPAQIAALDPAKATWFVDKAAHPC